MISLEDFREEVRKVLREEIEATIAKIKTDLLLNGWPKITYIELPDPSCKTCGDSGKLWLTSADGSTVSWSRCTDCAGGIR